MKKIFLLLFISLVSMMSFAENDLKSIKLVTNSSSIFDGNILENSILLGMDLSNSYQRLVLSKINKEKLFSIFSDANYSLIERDNNLKTSLYGVQAGIQFRLKDSSAILALHYTRGELEKNKLFKTNKDIVSGNVLAQNFGGNIGFRYYAPLGFELTQVFSVETLIKETKKNKQLLEQKTVDGVGSSYTEIAYDYFANINSKFGMGVRVYGGINNLVYGIGAQKEDSNFGYSNDLDIKYFVNVVIGGSIRVEIVKNLNISLFGDYTKYISDRSIKLDNTNTSYNLNEIILDDNMYNFGAKLDFKLGFARFGLTYNNQIIKKHNLSANVTFEF